MSRSFWMRKIIGLAVALLITVVVASPILRPFNRAQAVAQESGLLSGGMQDGASDGSRELTTSENSATLDQTPYALLCNFNRYRPQEQLLWQEDYTCWPTPKERKAAPCLPMSDKGFENSTAVCLDLARGEEYLTFRVAKTAGWYCDLAGAQQLLIFVDTGKSGVRLFLGLRGGDDGRTVYSTHKQEKASGYMLYLNGRWQHRSTTSDGCLRLSNYRGFVQIPLADFRSPLQENLPTDQPLTGFVLWYAPVGKVAPDAALLIDQIGVAGKALANPTGNLGMLLSGEQFDRPRIHPNNGSQENPSGQLPVKEELSGVKKSQNLTSTLLLSPFSFMIFGLLLAAIGTVIFYSRAKHRGSVPRTKAK